MTALAAAQKTLDRKGYLDIDVDPTIDLVAEIEQLKKEKNCAKISKLSQVRFYSNITKMARITKITTDCYKKNPSNLSWKIQRQTPHGLKILPLMMCVI